MTTKTSLKLNIDDQSDFDASVVRELNDRYGNVNLTITDLLEVIERLNAPVGINIQQVGDHKEFLLYHPYNEK